MKPTHKQWLNAMIQIRKTHEDAIRLVTLRAHDVEADGYERLCLKSFAEAAKELGFKLEPIADDSKAKGEVEALAREVS